jgi:hypothetical protein
MYAENDDSFSMTPPRSNPPSALGQNEDTTSVQPEEAAADETVQPDMHAIMTVENHRPCWGSTLRKGIDELQCKLHMQLLHFNLLLGLL